MLTPFLFSCAPMPIKNEIGPGELISNGIIREFTNTTRARGLIPMGFGHGQKKGKENFLQVNFNVNFSLTIDTARQLVVKSVEDFLECINHHSEYSEYCAAFPMTPKHVCIIISCAGASDQNEPTLGSVISGNGKVYYYSNSVSAPKLGLIHEETFEEARAILAHKQTFTENLWRPTARLRE